MNPEGKCDHYGVSIDRRLSNSVFLVFVFEGVIQRNH